MPAPVFIARLIGPIFVVVGIGLLLNLHHYAAVIAQAVRIGALVYFSGVLALAAGLAMLNTYRAWTADWRVIVTVLGWLMLIAGVVRIVVPWVTVSLATALYSGSAAIAIVGVIVLIVGGYLSFQGYRA